MRETNEQWPAAQQGSSEAMTMIQRERERLRRRLHGIDFTSARRLSMCSAYSCFAAASCIASSSLEAAASSLFPILELPSPSFLVPSRFLPLPNPASSLDLAPYLSIPFSLCSRSLSPSLFAWLFPRASESVFCFKNPLEATFHTNSKAQQYSSSSTSSR